MLAGLVALVAVVVVVAAVVAGGALAASRALGLADDGAINTGQTAQETLFLPQPSETEAPDGPAITLPGQPETATEEPERDRPTKAPEPVEPISVNAGQASVTPMGRIDLTGSYPEGEGAVLGVQRFESGQWSDFGVFASVTGGQFSTYIQSGAVGLNRFRLIDTDSGATSNEVEVQIG